MVVANVLPLASVEWDAVTANFKAAVATALMARHLVQEAAARRHPAPLERTVIHV